MQFFSTSLKTVCIAFQSVKSALSASSNHVYLTFVAGKTLTFSDNVRKSQYGNTYVCVFEWVHVYRLKTHFYALNDTPLKGLKIIIFCVFVFASNKTLEIMNSVRFFSKNTEMFATSVIGKFCFN